jgi:hypothetical protein
MLDRCPEQRELSWMCEVYRRYIFQAQEDKGIINSTWHRAQEGVMRTSSKDQMSNRYIVLMHMFTGKKTKMEYKLD